MNELSQQQQKVVDLRKNGREKDIEVVINLPLSINYIHQIEKALNSALGGLGFRQTTSSKGDITKINFTQFISERE